jgi:uncharacterized protein YbaP (TraB family)
VRPASLPARSLLVLTLLAGGAARAAEAPADAGDVTEVSVVGERAGPGLWKVTNGTHTLWLLGTLQPLPARMEWRSREVELVLSIAERLVPESPKVEADVSLFKKVKLYLQWRRLQKNPDGRQLADVLPPALYARFEAQRARYAPGSDDLLAYRPVIAAGRLWQAAVKRAGLTLEPAVADTVRRLAKARRVEVVEPKVVIEDPQRVLDELAHVPADAELRCMTATLDRLDRDVATARELATAWATGDVAALRASRPWEHREACWASLTTSPAVRALRTRLEASWFDAAVESLETRQTTLALVPMAKLLPDDGMLARFAARGYRVIAPEE